MFIKLKILGGNARKGLFIGDNATIGGLASTPTRKPRKSPRANMHEPNGVYPSRSGDEDQVRSAYFPDRIYSELIVASSDPNNMESRTDIPRLTDAALNIYDGLVAFPSSESKYLTPNLYKTYKTLPGGCLEKNCSGKSNENKSLLPESNVMDYLD